MRNMLIILIIGLLVGTTGTWWYFDNNLNRITEAPESEEVLNEFEIDEAEDIEAKIEGINQLEQLSRVEIDGSLEELFGDCNPEQEIEFLQQRYPCNRKYNKSEDFWNNMEEAESFLPQMIRDGEYVELFKYFGCDAYDLTWYELHCESDRTEVQTQRMRSLISYICKAGLSLKNARWIRKKPDPRKFRNPRWVWRSRLVFPNFKLSEPWNNESHPSEIETIILLEQKLSGRISIVGIPV